MYFDSIKVYLYSHNPLDFPHLKMDYGILKQIFDKHNLEQIKSFNLPKTEYAYVVISGQGNAWHEETINKELQNIKKLKLFIIADAYSYFDLDKIQHPNIEIWKQYPKPSHLNYKYFSAGTPSTFLNNKPLFNTKQNQLYFSGQLTHQRRQQLKNILPHIQDAKYRFSEIFSKGVPSNIYYQNMANAVITPCPSGEFILDTFRVYESIELLSLPIIDTINSYGKEDKYFETVYGSIPAPRIDNWNELPNIIEQSFKEYPVNLFNLVSWWINYKFDLEKAILDIKDKDYKITILNLNCGSKNFKNEYMNIMSICNTSKNTDKIILNITDCVNINDMNTIFLLLWNCLHEWINVLPKFNNVI